MFRVKGWGFEDRVSNFKKKYLKFQNKKKNYFGYFSPIILGCLNNLDFYL